MSVEYQPDELLALSGIQHFFFCRRQWALIRIENQWQENVLTVEGKLMHNRVDDPYFSEVRNGVVIARSVPVASYRLGLYGVCDLVEFSPDPQGVSLPGRTGTYQPAPVEYKRGREKRDECDEVQLCAQAMCLEEMLSMQKLVSDRKLVSDAIAWGYLYYGETRQRVKVELSEALRALVVKMAAEMHSYFKRGYTPKVKPSKACKSCSLADLCLPELLGNLRSASKYVQMQIEAD